MIEIEESARKSVLIYDGIRMEDDDQAYYIYRDTIHINDPQNDILSQIKTRNLLDIGTTINTIRLITNCDLTPNFIVDSVFDRIRGSNTWSFSFVFFPEYMIWANPWSIKIYMAKFIDVSTTIGSVSSAIEPLAAYTTLRVSFPAVQSGIKIDQAIENCLPTLYELHELTIKTLEATVHKDAVAVWFDFPEAVKVPCEQYLLYFVQFLKDVGVEASAELRHDAGQVLFSITPESGEEALDKIREALNVYLRLPANPTIGYEPVIAEGIEVQRLVANVQHLQGQLTLARAAVQAQAAIAQAQQQTIEAQQQTIYTQAALLTPEVLTNSLKGIAPTKDKDSEKILGGTVEITKYEGKGYAVNLPEIFRRLRERFSHPGRSGDGGSDL